MRASGLPALRATDGGPGAVSDSMPSAQRILHLARVHLVRTCGYGSLSLCQLFGALWSALPSRGERARRSHPGGQRIRLRWIGNAHRFPVAPVFHECRRAAPQRLRAGVVVRAQHAGQAGDTASSVHPKEPLQEPLQAGRNCTRQPSLDLGMVSCDRPGKSEAQKHYCTRALQPRTALSFPGSRRILRKFHSEGAWVESAKNLRATCMQHASDYRCYGRCLCAPLEYHRDWFLGVCCSEGVRHLLLHFVSSHRDGVQALPGEDPRPQRERPC